MTLLVFPNLTCIDIAQSKRPEIKSNVFVNPLSGRESRLRFQVYPKYTFKISVNDLIEYADETEMQYLLAFMVQAGGQVGAFLYKDPTDYLTIGHALGDGDGVETSFQLLRSYGGYTESVNNPDAATLAIYNDDVPVDQAGYTLTANGGIIFNTAPTDGASLTWMGEFYYRVRFMADGYDITRFAAHQYECLDIEFIGSVRNIV